MSKNNKKKAAKSGFFYFMMEIRADEEARGRHHSMEALKDIANIPWQELSAEEKAEYNQMAKIDKQKGKLDLTNKFTSLGISFAQQENDEREKEEERKLMLATIRNTVNAASSEVLLKKNFYVAHVNYYFITDEKVYAPCEIALAEFSLLEGIKNTLHFIVEPGEPPLGMRGTAKTWAEKTHGINLNMQKEELYREHNLLKIYSQIRDFMEKEFSSCGEKYVLPPIYTMVDSQTNNTSLSSVTSCMEQLCSASHESWKLFRVYPITELFYSLNLKWNTSQHIHSVAILTNLIEKDSFSNNSYLGCDFHEEKDLGAQCSLSIVKRWLYTICDLVCPKAGVELIPGKHVPLDVDVNWAVNTSQKTHNQPIEVKEKPSCSPLASKPTSVEHDELRERRVREKEMVSEELARAQNMPPPQKAWATQLPKGLEHDDFPPIGGGRGQPLAQIPSAFWPLSSRGKIIKK